MSKLDIRRKSMIWLGGMIVVATALFLGGSLRLSTRLGGILFIVFGLLLSGFLFTEGGIAEYLRQKRYKTITGSDFLVWFTFIFASWVLVTTLLFIPAFNNVAPSWLISFIKMSAGIGGAGAFITTILHMLLPTPKG